MVSQGADPGAGAISTRSARVLGDDGLDPAFRALCLRLPGEDDMAADPADAGQMPDPDAIHSRAQALAHGARPAAGSAAGRDL